MRNIRRLRPLLVALTAMPISAMTVGGAQAAETAKLTVSFSPYRLGVNSAFTVVTQIHSTTAAVPSAVTNFALRLPAGMGLSTSQLGLSTCRSEVLQVDGVAGCPPEATMGSGTATLVNAVGSEEIEASAAVTMLMAPSLNEQTRFFVYGKAQTDVMAEFVFAGLMTGVSPPFGTLVGVTAPPVVGVPGTPPAALTRIALTLGPPGLRYVKRVNGAMVRYHPKGLAVPGTCPSGGFPFAVKLGFADGTYAEATTNLACPPAAARGRTRGPAGTHGHAGARRHGRRR